MKKTLLFILVIAIMVFMIESTTYAAALTANVSVEPDKTEVNPGDMVTFNIKIKNIQNADGGAVTAVGGELTYNTNFFEVVSTDSGTATTNWDNGKFNVTCQASSDQTVGTIKLKVKQNPTGEGAITFSKLSASDGETETTPEDQNKTVITVKTQSGNENTTGGNTAGENTAGENTAGENTTGGNTAGENTAGENTTGENTVGENTAGENTAGENTAGENTAADNRIAEIAGNASSSGQSQKTDDTVANKIIPKTGKGFTILISIIVLAISGIFTYVKYNEYKSIK